MQNSFTKILQGYKLFREKYASTDASLMQQLTLSGQKPEIMIVACCDSRVDPALILQCDPGDLFVVRNIANIVPSYNAASLYQGTSAALEFGICFLKVKHLILLGHSQCGGIEALLNNHQENHNDFINNWVSLVKTENCPFSNPNDYAKLALKKSYQNCLTFPWLKQKVFYQDLEIHLWYFDIKTGEIQTYLNATDEYVPLIK